MESADFMFEVIPSDFSVDLLSRNGDLALYGALRKGGTERVKGSGGVWESHVMGVWHLVSLTGQGQGNSICQWHVPRYRMAQELNGLLSVGKGSSALPRPTITPLAPGLDLVMLEKEELGFRVGGAEGRHPIVKTEFRNKLMRELKTLSEAQADMVEEDGEFHLKRATTPAGHPVQSQRGELIEAIAFERVCLGRLDAGNFGIYSAYCTYRDFDTSIGMEESTIEGLVEQQLAIPPERLNGDMLGAFIQAQEAALAKPIWGKGVKVTKKKACEVVAAGMRTLSRPQRVQFILMHGMHDASLLLALAAAAKVITFEKYAELQCQPFQPDSPQEQDLRKETAYIKLYGELAGQEN